MTKKLSELTQEELWQLFPIFLTEPKPQWAAIYAAAEARFKEVLAAYVPFRISHVGSTAIPGIWAKNIVDVMIELAPGTDMEAVAQEIEAQGFTRKFTEEGRIFLHLGYTEQGFADEVIHLHLRYRGDNDELYFRDYLLENPECAREYEALKMRLWKQYAHNRDAYTEGKTAFIRKQTEAVCVRPRAPMHSLDLLAQSIYT